MDDIHIVSTRRDLTSIRSPRRSEIFHIRTADDGIEIFRDAEGLAVVDAAGNTHRTYDGSHWRDLVAMLLGLATECQSRRQAKERVLQARIGSMVDASDDYLLQLRASLHGWIDEITAELNIRIEAARQKEIES